MKHVAIIIKARLIAVELASNYSSVRCLQDLFLKVIVVEFLATLRAEYFVTMDGTPAVVAVIGALRSGSGVLLFFHNVCLRLNVSVGSYWCEGAVLYGGVRPQPFFSINSINLVSRPSNLPSASASSCSACMTADCFPSGIFRYIAQASANGSRLCSCW